MPTSKRSLDLGRAVWTHGLQFSLSSIPIIPFPISRAVGFLIRSEVDKT